MSGKRYNWEDIKKDYKTLSRAEVKVKYGISQGAWSSALKRGYIALKPEDEHFGGNKKRNINEVLIKDSPHKDITSLKNRLLKENILINKCYICGIYRWNDNALILHLDHVNGDKSDNRLINLRMLCPNCHSQTPTYCGKNRKS